MSERKPRRIPGYTLAHFALDYVFVSVTEPHRLAEHAAVMLPQVSKMPKKRGRQP